MRRFLIFVALFVGLILSAAVIVPMLFREQIVEQVKSQMNSVLRAKLNFEQLNISLLRRFPNASLEIHALTLIGTERFVGDTIASVDRVSVVVDLWSLFGNQGFEVSKLFINAPKLHARRLADGAVNWDIIKYSEPVVDSISPPITTSEATSEATVPFRLQLRDVRINDASLSLRDDSTGLHSYVNPLSLRLKGDMSVAQSELDVRLLAGGVRVVYGGMTLLSGAEAEVDARVVADLDKMRFKFADNILRLNAIRIGVDGWVEFRHQSLALDLKASCEQVHFKDILSLIPAFYKRDYNNLTATGDMSLSLWVRGENRRSSMPAFELKMGVKQGGFRYSSLFKEVSDVNIVARVANPGGAIDKTVVDIPTFDMKMGSNSLSASLHATNFISDPIFRIAARGKIDLSQIKDVYPLEAGVEMDGFLAADLKAAGRMSDIDNKRYEQMSASGTFVIEQMDANLKGLPEIHIRRAAATITPLAMTLGEFGITVGHSDLSANGQLTNYLGALLRGDKLTGRLYLKSDLLDLNELLTKGVDAPKSTSSATSSTEASTNDLGELQAPQIPANLNIDLVADIRRILFAEMVVSDLSGHLFIADNTLKISDLALHVFDGSALASGSYSTPVGALQPQLNLSVLLSKASFAKSFDQMEVVRKLVPLFDKTGGDYSLSLNLITPLNSDLSPDVKGLNANGELRSANIRLQNIKAFNQLAKVMKNDALSKIEARDIAIAFEIRDGRIATKPFDLKLGGYNVELEGSTGLDQTIDYRALVALPATMQGFDKEKISISIKGTFDNPKITLGLKEMVSESIKDVIGQQIDKISGGKPLDQTLKQEFEEMRQQAKKSTEKLIDAAKTQSAKLVEAAEKKGAIAKFAAKATADKLISEAEAKAAKIEADIERKIEELTKKAEDSKQK